MALETIRDSVTAKRASARKGLRGNFVSLTSKQIGVRYGPKFALGFWRHPPTNPILAYLKEVWLGFSVPYLNWGLLGFSVPYLNIGKASFRDAGRIITGDTCGRSKDI